jgi:hypothetical protein
VELKPSYYLQAEANLDAIGDEDMQGELALDVGA